MSSRLLLLPASGARYQWSNWENLFFAIFKNDSLETAHSPVCDATHSSLGIVDSLVCFLQKADKSVRATDWRPVMPICVCAIGSSNSPIHRPSIPTHPHIFCIIPLPYSAIIC